MKILLCINDAMHGVGESLERIVGNVIPKGSLWICHSLKDFPQTLHRCPWGGCKIAVILATNKQELEEFVSLRELLDGLSIILILPDRRNETISRGHCLYPRFVTYVDSDFKDVAAVLEKMIRNASDKDYS